MDVFDESSETNLSDDTGSNPEPAAGGEQPMRPKSEQIDENSGLETSPPAADEPAVGGAEAEPANSEALAAGSQSTASESANQPPPTPDNGAAQEVVDDSSSVEDDDDDDFDDDPNVKPLEDISAEVADEDIEMQWYILKVQSNRENSICDALHRRVAVEGLERYFGEILVPTEDVAEFKNGKRRVVKRKLYPGYIVAHMMLTDETWFAVRETPGIGDFTGSAGKPSPMLPHEIEQIVKSSKPDDESDEPIKTAIPYKVGDRVRIKDGTFENFEGDVEGIDEANGRITVVINIFNRSTPVELEHWQIENV